MTGKNPLLALSTSKAACIAVASTILYVLPFYLSPSTRPSPNLSRDAPSVIRARIRSVFLSTSLCTLFAIYILSTHASASLAEGLRLLGWYPVSVIDIAKALLLTVLLFAGPVFEKGIIESGWKSWITGQSLYESLSSWIGWRNYVAGPVTEEIVFRSVFTSIHLLTSLSPTRIVFLTPLYFGIAHIHHFYEYTLTHPHTPVLPALLRSLLQFSYTSIFGWYAEFLFLRTGSLPAVVLAHSFCNWGGLPRLWGRVKAEGVIGPVGVVKEKEDREHDDGDQDLGIMWSVAYYAVLVGGLVAFYNGFWGLTESERALAKFG